MTGITDFSLRDFSLTGKTALITGGNTGIGQALGLAMARAGANIFVVSLRDDQGETEQLIRGTQQQYGFEAMDLSQPKAPQAAVDAAIKAFGQVDILVNNAGLNLVADVLDYDRELWDPMVEVNLSVPYAMTQAVAKHMVPRRQGKIINICSMFSFLGCTQSPAYAATKHGIAGLTKAYCNELAAHNIQVNGIAPGYFATELARKTRENPEANRQVVEHIPAGEWGELRDLMGAAVFLASPAANYVNGHILAVDGGYLTK